MSKQNDEKSYRRGTEFVPQHSADFYMHTVDKPHKEWYNRGLMAGRMGDKRGHIAHGKAKARTSHSNKRSSEK